MENIKEIDIIITLVAGTLVMFVMAGVVVFFVIQYQKRILKQRETLRLIEIKYQNELLDASLTATEKERERVAKNIHDEIGTLINVIKLNNGGLKKNLNDNAKTLELINNNNQLLIEINENVRSIYNDLVSPTLVKLGFVRAVHQLCSQINSADTVKITIVPEDLKIRFDSKVEIQLFRICKEVLNNILKHSNSTEIHIDLNLSEDLISIPVTYNGKGINDEDAKVIMENNKGLGLKSIYSRAQVLEGTISYFTPKGENAVVLIKIPIKK